MLVGGGGGRMHGLMAADVTVQKGFVNNRSL